LTIHPARARHFRIDDGPATLSAPGGPPLLT
jgi:hypothetical protein